MGDERQIVIPSVAAKELVIEPGDFLVIMAARNQRGTVMVKADASNDLADTITQGLKVTDETRSEK